MNAIVYTDQLVNELSFLGALLVTIFFYKEYKKYTEQIKKQEMLDRFLND